MILRELLGSPGCSWLAGREGGYRERDKGSLVLVELCTLSRSDGRRPVSPEHHVVAGVLVQHPEASI